MIKFWFTRIYIGKKATIEDCPKRYREDVIKMAKEHGYEVEE